MGNIISVLMSERYGLTLFQRCMPVWYILIVISCFGNTLSVHRLQVMFMLFLRYRQFGFLISLIRPFYYHKLKPINRNMVSQIQIYFKISQTRFYDIAK